MPAEVAPPARDRWCDIDGAHLENPERGALFSRLAHQDAVQCFVPRSVRSTKPAKWIGPLWSCQTCGGQWWLSAVNPQSYLDSVGTRDR